MKQYLFAAALMVALIGCSKSSSDRMGSAASRETGSYSSAADTTSVRNRSMTATNDTTGISGSGSESLTVTPPATQGGAGVSVESTDTSQAQPAQPAQPEQPQQPQQSDQNSGAQNQDQNQPQQPQQSGDQSAITGDQSNGDLSNRPAGAPGVSQSESSSSSADNNSSSTSNDSSQNQNKDNSQDSSQQQQQDQQPPL